jgi:hypothetical protein
MEAGGKPPEAPQTAPSTPTGEAERMGGQWRWLGVLLALALAFAAAVMVVRVVEIGDLPRCDDQAAIDAKSAETGEAQIDCFKGSQTKKTISVAAGWPSGAVAAVASLLALYFAATGRRGPLLLRLTTAAIVLGAISIVTRSI